MKHLKSFNEELFFKSQEKMVKQYEKKEKIFRDIIEELRDKWIISEKKNPRNEIIYICDLGKSIKEEYYPGFEIKIECDIDEDGDKIIIQFDNRNIQEKIDKTVISNPFKNVSTLKNSIVNTLEKYKKFFKESIKNKKISEKLGVKFSKRNLGR